MKKKQALTITVQIEGNIDPKVPLYFKRHPEELGRAVTYIFATRVEQFARLELALLYMQKHCCRGDLCESEVARQIGLRAPTFSALFRKLLGENYTMRLTKMRVAAAKALLRREGLVREVARQVGFSHSNTLSEAFMRTVGINPCAFRIHALARRNGHNGRN